MNDKKMIAFDLYGTCITTPCKEPFNKKMLSFFYDKISAYKELRDILQLEPLDIDEANEKIKDKMPDDIIKILKESTQKDIAQAVLYPDFIDTIDYIKSKWYKTAVVSNLSKDYAKPLENLIPCNTFDYEILSFNVWAKKPDPKIFEQLKKISSIDYKDTIFVWDSVSMDVKWAQNVWIDPILIDRNTKNWSYDKDFIVIHSLTELKKILSI